jgi:16S rRNA (cytosine967-C5)-methyltransferase
LTNPLTDPYFILTKVYSGGKYLKQAIADTVIEPLNKARTIKICYGVLEKDVYLNYVIAQNTQSSPKSAVRLILKIALYMLEFMEKHDYMVVDSAVTLTKKLGKSGAAGFVNAFLRSYKLPELPLQTDERLSLETSTPLWLVKRVRRSYKGQAADILSAKSHGVCVRFESGEEEYLAKPHEDTPFNGVYIFKNFERDIGFMTGAYTFQSVGSVAICEAVEPCDKFLDACAAPGGKSVLISKKCKEVTSSELHEHRAELISSYIKRMNVQNVTVKVADSSVYNSAFDGAFDGVLCDVPCSGTGVINENPDIMLNRKPEDIDELTKIQYSILSNCSRYVKEGGRLYYSTCSILPEENDSIVYKFLSENKGFTLDIPGSPLSAMRTKFGLQFLPNISQGVGFFLTAFKKL